MGGSNIYNEIWWMLYSEGGVGCGGEAQTGQVLLHLLPTDVRLEVKPLAHAVEQGSGLRAEGNVQMRAGAFTPCPFAEADPGLWWKWLCVPPRPLMRLPFPSRCVNRH